MQLKRGNMSEQALITQMVQFEGKDGTTLPAYLSRLESGDLSPAIIVLHEVFGLTEHIKDVSDRLAREGYVVLAPDLLARERPPKVGADREVLFQFFAKIPDQRVLSDLDQAIEYLKGLWFVNSDRLAVIGFCMGGTYSLLLAENSKQLAAALVFYGMLFYPEITENKPAMPISGTEAISCPLLGFFGGRDHVIPARHIKEFEERLKGAGKVFQLYIYPNADHAFFNDARENYRLEEARDAWKRTLKFLEVYLK